MSSKTLFIAALLFTFFTQTLSAESMDFKNLTGSWHLLAIDGKEVRKARSIVEFDGKNMKISGFDACNRITGLLRVDAKTKYYYTNLTKTRMACRSSLHSYVSHTLHKTFDARFIITKEKKYGVNGITIKSAKHELFFKKMGKDSLF
ncbi:MAG: META domain-containing protein [Sulfurovum sp.]|nr:META domain-containing protein [Sulfurovum sp.]